MIEGRPDWCISRQRTWGVPIPFFVHKDTNELHPRTPELIEEVAKLIEQKVLMHGLTVMQKTSLVKMLNSTMLFAIRLMYGLTLVQRIMLYLSNVKN